MSQKVAPQKPNPPNRAPKSAAQNHPASPQETGAAQPLDGLSIPEFPEIPLPEIILPDIPPLQLDIPEPAPSIKTKKPFAYGSNTPGAGPVSLFATPQFGPGSKDAAGKPVTVQAPVNVGGIGWELPQIQIKVPGSIAVHSINDLSSPRMPAPTTERVPTSAEITNASVPPTTPPRIRKSTKAVPVRTAPKSRPEPPPVQRPLKEREISFEEASPDLTRTRVDLTRGVIAQNGVEQALTASSRQALLKIQSFLCSEFPPGLRNDIMAQIDERAQQGEKIGELLKLVVGPVIKLGNKRYGIINELLLFKEELPRFERQVALAILHGVLKSD